MCIIVGIICGVDSSRVAGVAKWLYLLEGFSKERVGPRAYIHAGGELMD